MTESRDRHRFTVDHAGKTITFEIVPEKGLPHDSFTTAINADISTADFVVQISAEAITDYECDALEYALFIAKAVERALHALSVTLTAAERERLKLDVHRWLCEQRGDESSATK